MCTFESVWYKRFTKFISTCSNCVKGFRILQAANSVTVSITVFADHSVNKLKYIFRQKKTATINISKNKTNADDR